MAYLRQKRYLVELPEGADVVVKDGEEWATWRNKRGAKKGLIVRTPDGKALVEQHTETWCIRGRDASGRDYELSTGCKNRKLAERKLAEHEAVQERVRAGFMTKEDCQALSWINVSLTKHLADYTEWQRARGLHKNTLKTRNSYLNEMFTGLKWHTVKDLCRSGAENWTHKRMQARKNSPRTYNAIVAAAHAFGTWLLRQGRIQNNPFDGWVQLNEAIDKRRERRAMTEEEVAAFLEAAAVRPLEQRLLAWPTMNEASRARYRAEGRERVLVYQTLLQTGLRWGELRSISIGQACLTETPPYLLLHARSEKNRQGAMIALREDLHAAITAHLERITEDRPGWMSDEQWTARPLFSMGPSGLRGLNQDLAWANLEKRDVNGKVLDVHALRHTFGTMLAKSGVSLVIAQRAMRHSTPDLTANLYTHLETADVRDACESLPSITPKREMVGIEAGHGAEDDRGAAVPSDYPPLECSPMQPYAQQKTREHLESLSREELIDLLTQGLDYRCTN